METDVEKMCWDAKAASVALAQLTTEEKNSALEAMVKALKLHQAEILALNKKEVTIAISNNVSNAYIDRMSFTADRFQAMVDGMQRIVALADPVGRVLASWKVQSGLQISRVATPLGVIAVIYESRPNVTADAASLCFKSGNAIILRGGSECEKTNRAIVSALQQGLKNVGFTPFAIQYIPSQHRQELGHLLKMNQYIDVIIPRGGKNLIERVLRESSIPVFRHLDGICHTYIHEAADLAMAVLITCNAKMRRTGICGATETLLIDRAIATTYLPNIIDALIAQGCEIRGDILTQAVDARVKPATEKDWSTEYLDAILSIKVVEDIAEAIQHIQQYGSGHTDAIITADPIAAELFLQQVDSANVMHNCSTQFADGGEFGMGAEMGIATGKLHARGPIGLEQLTIFKYIVRGEGQLRPI